MAKVDRKYIPAFFKVIHQRLRFILWKDQDLIELRIDAVAQRYIDQPVYAPKWDGGFGTVTGQRHQPRTLAPRHDYGQYILHWYRFLLCCIEQSHRIGRKFTA